MPPVYSTPRNRRIDERVLESLRQRDLLSSMYQRLDEMGAVQAGFKSPQEGYRSMQSQANRHGTRGLFSQAGDQLQVKEQVQTAARTPNGRQAARQAGAGRVAPYKAQSADLEGARPDGKPTRQEGQGMYQAESALKQPSGPQDVQSPGSSAESQRPEPQIIRPGDMRKSAKPVAKQRSQSFSGDSYENALYLSQDDAQAEEISQVLMQQEEELEALRRRNADLIELLQQSRLLNDVEMRNVAIYCDQGLGGAFSMAGEGNEDIYSIDPPAYNFVRSVLGGASAVQQRDNQEVKNPAPEEQNLKQQDYPEPAEVRPQVRVQLYDYSEKLQIQQAQILELSYQLNKQKEYENQLIEELMKMQRMAYNDDFKDSTMKMDTELLARNYQLEAYNRYLQKQLEQFNKKKADQKYQKQREKYQQLKGKYIELQRQAQELNDILQNEQNETQVVIKELVQDIEEMKLRSERKFQDD